jgi:hypothetical protein
VTSDPFREGLAAARRGDLAAAARLWEPLAVNGDPRAQYNLGYLHANGQGVARDYPRAIGWYTRAAHQGFAPAQFNLGVLLSGHEGITPDYPAALAWYHKAAAQGDADAQYNLGVACASGQGVPVDFVAAWRWYSQAAGRGHAGARRTLESLEVEMTPEQLAAARSAGPGDGG